MADAEAPSAPRPSGRDLTSGAITPALLAFALPTLASNILQSLNGSINSVWVGQFLGEGALAATSNANVIMFLSVALVFGFGMAATIIVGQAWGQGDRDQARRAVGSALGALGTLALLIALAGWLATPALLRLMATPAAVQPLAEAYMRMIFLGLPASFISVILMMALRGTGDAVTPFWFMLLSVALDAGLNPVLILGLGPAPRLGIAGSGLATAIAAWTSMLAMVAAIYLRDLPIRLREGELRYLRPAAALVRVMLVKGVPMGLQMIVLSLAQIAVIGTVNRQGVVVTAAYAVTLQLLTYVQMPAMALGAAVSAMAAQNIGAGRWDRVGRITRAGLVCNVVLTGALAVLLTLVDRAVLGLFLDPGSAAMPVARHIQLVTSWSFILFGATIVLFGTMRANGAVYGPLAIMFVAMLPVRIGLMLAFEPRYGAEAIWWTQPAGSLTALALAVAYYHYGGWRKGKLLVPPEPETRAQADATPEGRPVPTG